MDEHIYPNFVTAIIIVMAYAHCDMSS